MNIKKYTTLRPDGCEIITDKFNDKIKQEADTKQCCHCGAHWKIQPGSGITRGYCFICNDLTCGSPRCANHGNKMGIL